MLKCGNGNSGHVSADSPRDWGRSYASPRISEHESVVLICALVSAGTPRRPTSSPTPSWPFCLSDKALGCRPRRPPPGGRGRRATAIQSARLGRRPNCLGHPAVGPVTSRPGRRAPTRKIRPTSARSPALGYLVQETPPRPASPASTPRSPPGTTTSSRAILCGPWTTFTGT